VVTALTLWYRPPGHAHVFRRQTVAFILAHLEHKLSLVDLAAGVQMSPAHFARLFKGATGQTPHGPGEVVTGRD